MNIEDVFSKLRPVLGPQLDLLWQEYLVSDGEIRRTIERTLRVTLAQRLGETYQANHVLLRPPAKDLAAGEYPAGSVHYGRSRFCPFGLREPEFIQHVGIFGRSGGGKTNLAYLLLEGLVRAGKPFLVFDWKRNYRDLTAKPAFADLDVFTVGRDLAPFFFNPLIPPPGTQPTVWLKKLIEIMCHAYFLGEGVTVLLMRAMDALYRQAGLYDGRPTGYPNMAHVRELLLNSKPRGRAAGWMESALRAVEVLCYGEMGTVLNSSRCHDIAKLLGRRVILELDALTNADKTFLIESLLLWIHHYRLAQPDRERFKHAIIIEEAHHILLRKKQEVTGEESVTDVLLREIRELGEAIICLDQHPSLISKPALGNTYTTFAFNLKHRGDIAMMADCLHLDGEQAGYLGRLEVGWAMVKLQGRWFFPFLVKLPLMPVAKGSVSDEAIARRAGREVQGELPRPKEAFCGFVPARQGRSAPAAPQGASVPPVPHSGKSEKGKGNNQCAIELTTQEREFLEDIWRHPTSTIRQRYRCLSLSPRKGTCLQCSLLSSGLIFCSRVSLPHGRTKILSLSEKGRKLLGISGGESDRHGGPEHRYWSKLLAERLRQHGYDVTEEAPIGNGKAVDILAVKDGRRIAFEIETGKSDAAGNVRKCLDAGMDRVLVVATSAAARNAIAAQLPQEGPVELLSPGDVVQRLSATGSSPGTPGSPAPERGSGRSPSSPAGRGRGSS